MDVGYSEKVIFFYTADSSDQRPPRISEVVIDFTNELNELDRRLDKKMQKLRRLSDETQRSIDDYARDTEEMENALIRAKQEQVSFFRGISCT